MAISLKRRSVIPWLTIPLLLGLASGRATARDFTYVSIRLDSGLRVSSQPNSETLSESTSELTINDVVHRVTFCPREGDMVCFCTSAYCFAVPARVSDGIKNWNYGKQKFSVIGAPENELAVSSLPGVLFIESTFVGDNKRRILFLYSLKRGLIGYTLRSAIGTKDEATALISSLDGVGFGCQQCGSSD